MNLDCRLLLADPDMVTLCETLNQIYLNEGEIPPANILERLDEKGAQERFREVLFAPPIYSVEEVEQAVNEFEDRIHKLEPPDNLPQRINSEDAELYGVLWHQLNPNESLLGVCKFCLNPSELLVKAGEAKVLIDG